MEERAAQIPGAAKMGDTASVVNYLRETGCVPTRRVFQADEVIHDSNDPAESIYFIESGEVRLYHVSGKSQRLLDILGPNDWIGMEALAGLATLGKRAAAHSESVLQVIPLEQMKQQISQRGDLALSILQSMAMRLQDAWSQGSALASEDCRNRLIKTLLRFSTSSAATPNVSGDEGVVLRITHSQLAQAVGAARETVSVCLTELRRENFVKTGRNRVMFNPVRLRELDDQAEVTEKS